MSDTGSKVPHTWILLGLVVGAIVGMAANLAVENGSFPADTLKWIITNITRPIGSVFLSLLFMTVVPLVFASLAVGVAKLGDLAELGRMGAKTFSFFLATMLMSVVIGLVLVNLVRPGEGLPEETQRELHASFSSDAAKKSKPAEFGVQTFVNIVPRNPVAAAATDPPNMLGIIVFALLIGVGMTKLKGPQAEVAMHGLEAVGDLMVFIIGFAMKIAPVGVFCLIFSTTADLGLQVLGMLAKYVIVVLAGLLLQSLVVLPVLVRVLGRMNPLTFFARSKVVIITAFSTSSSSATLPTSIRTAENELGVPPTVAGFVLPLGATINMNGTALFEGVTVVFLAQVMGVDLSLGQQLIVILLSVLTAVGAAGVPGGSIPLLAMVMATVGVPPEAIFLILGVDRILDMCRTTLNVLGDLAAAVFVARSEQKRLPDGGTLVGTIEE